MQIPGTLFPERLIGGGPQICILLPTRWLWSNHLRLHFENYSVWELHSQSREGTAYILIQQTRVHVPATALTSHVTFSGSFNLPKTPHHGANFCLVLVSAEDKRGNINESLCKSLSLHKWYLEYSYCWGTCQRWPVYILNLIYHLEDIYCTFTLHKASWRMYFPWPIYNPVRGFQASHMGN